MSNHGHDVRAGILAGAAAVCLSLLAMRAAVGAPVAAAAPAPLVAAAAAPTATPVSVTLMPAAPGLAQNAVARFTFARHFYYLGDRIQGRITLLDHLCATAKACYEGTDWTRAGAPAGTCKARALTCSWKVTVATGPTWFVAHMPISSTVAQTDSDDFYTVVDKNQTVLDGMVTDVAGAPIAGVTMTIGGSRTVRLPVDPTGYFSAFLPRGRYTVGLDAGSRAADRWFQPRARTVTLRAFASVRFTGYDHTTTTVSQGAAAPTGLDAITVTVRALNPFGMPVPGHMVTVDTYGADALLCAAAPSTGRLEPQRVVHGTPLFAPVYQTTNSSGALTYRAYIGTQSGGWTVTANDGDVARLSPRTTLAGSRARVTVRPGAWLRFFPQRFMTRIYAKNGASKRVSLSLPQLVLAAIQGRTVRAPIHRHGFHHPAVRRRCGGKSAHDAAVDSGVHAADRVGDRPRRGRRRFRLWGRHLRP